MVRQYRYIDFRDREQIAARYLNGDRVADIAAGLGVTTATVYRELKRGETGELDRNQRPGIQPRSCTTESSGEFQAAREARRGEC